jgi:UDP-glucose 4-epimerase
MVIGVSLRFCNVYGPRSNRKNSVVAKFIKLAMQGETLEIYGDGNQTRDFIYIGDLINAIRLSSSMDGIGGETFQIANSSETTINELVDIIVSILKESGIEDAKINHSSPRLGDVK